MSKKNRLVEYVNTHLNRELTIVKAGSIALVNSVLTLEERTLIYKYSEDGFESLNQGLRVNRGENKTEFGKLLDRTLKKMPNFKGLVYRSVNLNQIELKLYQDAYEKNVKLVEYTFVSTTKSQYIANMFGGNCRFTIISQSGKEIEKFAKYGESEVLICPNRKFNILEVTKVGNYTLINYNGGG